MPPQLAALVTSARSDGQLWWQMVSLQQLGQVSVLIQVGGVCTQQNVLVVQLVPIAIPSLPRGQGNGGQDVATTDY